MATGGVRERSSGNTNDDFRHTCGLCMEPYKGRQPKLLPCFHTFCLPCLTALAESAVVQTRSKATGERGGEKEPVQIVAEESGETTEQTEEGGQEKSLEKGQCGEESVPSDGVCTQPVVFLCPTCRRPVTLPEGGVTQLQTNFYLDHDQEDETSRALLCDLCEEDRKQNATHVCQECRMNLCQPCRKTHDRFPGARSHHVTPLGQGDLRVTPQPERKLCQSHHDQTLFFFCQKCDASICLHCKLTSHEGHVTVDMAVACVQAKPEVDKLKVKLDEQIRVMGSLLERLENDRLLARKKQEVTREVSTRYDVAVTWLTQARDDVMHTLTTKEQTLLRELQDEMTKVRVAMDTLQPAQSRAIRALDCGPDVVHVKTELQAVLLDDVTIRQHGERAAREGEAFFFQCEEGVDEGLLRDYIGHVRDGHKQDGAPVNNITPQLADLITEMAALKANLTKTASDSVARDDKLTTTVDTLTAQLSSLSDKTQKAVFFHASLTGNKTFNLGAAIVFNKVLSNMGDAYDRNTGFFTAPVKGTYLFLVTVGNQGLSGTVVARIEVDGNDDCARARSSPESVGSCHVVTKLDSGKKVRVITTGLDNTLCNLDTWFSGVLIT